MKEKKNIDEIFQNAFEKADVSPSPRVWENIRTRLDQEKSDRKVIPLWIRLGGVAAILAIVLTAGNFFFNPFNADKTLFPVITEETVEQPNQENKESKDVISPVENSEIVSSDSSEDSDDKNSITPSTNSTISTKSDVVKAQDKKSEATVSSKEGFAKANQISDSEKETIQDLEKNPISLPEKTADQEIAERKTKDKENQYVETHQVLKKDREALAGNEIQIEKEKSESEDKDLRPSLLDAIAEQNEIKSSQNQQTKIADDNRWRVTPNLAPVYYGSFGSGSSIDPEFSHNPQQGDVNMSYGIQVSYALNNKLRLRTGVNNVDLSYNTSDIIIAAGPASQGLEAVRYYSNNTVITAISKRRFSGSDLGGGTSGLNLKSSAGDARLIQEMNYLEVPLELEYALIDSRFGVHLIGGVSTLFLGNNEISVKSSDFHQVLGSANNLSNVSFSTNLGVGVQYRLTSRFLFNIEPTFKYQLNTYSDSSVDFKPYYLGVYSGLSFKF